MYAFKITDKQMHTLLIFKSIEMIYANKTKKSNFKHLFEKEET